jgi:serine O-acetyltransferase
MTSEGQKRSKMSAAESKRQNRASFCDWEAGELEAVVDALCEITSADGSTVETITHGQTLPSRDEVVAIVETLRSALFPGYFAVCDPSADSVHFHIGSTLDTALKALKEQVRRNLLFQSLNGGSAGAKAGADSDFDAEALRITKAFVKRLPEVKRLLETDVRAAYDGDPAATSHDEVIACYPGFLAVTNYRIAHELHKLGLVLISRMITEHAHAITGIDIHPGAEIGERFFIDHGTGVVIGGTTIIRKNVRLYQGVTLGAKSFSLDKDGKPIKGVPRHPIVEDDVIIYAGATILGRITIGRGSVIGGNVWITKDVPPNSKVTQSPTREDIFETGAGI